MCVKQQICMYRMCGENAVEGDMVCVKHLEMVSHIKPKEENTLEITENFQQLPLELKHNYPLSLCKSAVNSSEQRVVVETLKNSNQSMLTVFSVGDQTIELSHEQLDLLSSVMETHLSIYLFNRLLG